MKSEYFLNVSSEESAYDYLNKMDENTLLIFSPTSMNKIKINNKKMKAENWHNISKDVDNIDDYIKSLNNIKEVVTFGGGSTIDIGKYISYRLNTKYTCIPSMLSTNSYATNKVALIKDMEKTTLDAKVPDKIIIDNEVLRLSEKENLYGLADVLSIYTALYDWKIAKEDIGESLNQEIYSKARDLLDKVLNFIEAKSLQQIKEDNIQLFEFIGIAGYITNLYGTGRPESGSEHIFAKILESKIDIPHGISVSLGIIIMTILQGRKEQKIKQAILKIQVLEDRKEYGINKELIQKCLQDIKPREGRYTIIDRYLKSNKNIEEVLRQH